VRNVLSHLRIFPDQPKQKDTQEDRLILRIPGQPGFVFATTEGVFEPYHRLGMNVREGEKAGRIHNLAHPWREPEILHYAIDGMVYGQRQPGRVVTGSCCVALATAFEGDLG